mmetsp:Transcript_57580/g.141189  ORF Transcript_57580/g.141189 Transcript_57580/m.141189 type:complete len:466 (+) Transcript_57580:40-1437(+)
MPPNTIVPSRTFISNKTDGRIRGIGLNGKPCQEDVAKRVIPSQFKILGGGVLASGSWLNLGNEPGVDERDQIVNGQSNMGLMAALLVTIQFAFMFVLPDIRSSLFERSWIISQLEPGMDDVIYDVMMTANLSAAVLGTLCMVYSVFIILMCGEMTGAAEITLLSQLMGWRMNGSIILFVLSIVLSALVYSLFTLCASLSLGGVVATLGLLVLLVLLVLVFMLGPLIRAGILSKALNASNHPLCLSKSQLESLFQEFCAIAGGGEYVTQESFEDYLALLVRNKDIKLGRTKTLLGDKTLEAGNDLETAVLNVMSLSGTTKQLARNCVEEYLEAHAHFGNDKEQIVLTSAECADMVRSHAAEIGEEKVAPGKFMHFVHSHVFQVQDIKDLAAAAESKDLVLSDTARILVKKVQEIHAQKEAEGVQKRVPEEEREQQRKLRRFEIAYISGERLQNAVDEFCKKRIAEF